MKPDEKSDTNKSDDDVPQTFRNDTCYQELFDSYNLGSIYDNAQQFPNKAAARDAAPSSGQWDGYSIVAKNGGTEGLLITELFSVIATTWTGGLTTRELLGRVTIESNE